MYIIGLTGGAATGKSAVSEILKGLGAIIIDVDSIGRETVKKGSPYLTEIAIRFGKDVLNPDGSLNRGKLGDIVFADKDKLELLNSIVHPVMVERVKEQLQCIKKKKNAGTVIVDAALLTEMGLDKLVDCVWLIRADRKTRTERLMARSGMTKEKAENIIDSQMTMEEKGMYADKIIDNSGTLKDLRDEICSLWEKR